jgi:hypothetical protein
VRNGAALAFFPGGAARFVRHPDPARSGEWRVYEARHFTIYSESPPAKVAELAARMERYDK